MKHYIKKGETLSGIAKRYGVSVNEILAANPKITDRNKIYADDMISVPVFGQLRRGLARLASWFRL